MGSDTANMAAEKKKDGTRYQTRVWGQTDKNEETKGKG